MRAVWARWKSRAGASFATAMYVFVACSVFATTIMSIAHSLMASTADQLSDEQTFLSVSCASRLLTEVVEDCSVYRKDPVVGATTYVTSKTFRYDMGMIELSDSYATAVEKALADGLTTRSSSTTLTISNDNMGEVKITLGLSNWETVTAIVTAGDNRVILTFKGRELPPAVERFGTEDTNRDEKIATYQELKWSLDGIAKGTP